MTISVRVRYLGPLRTIVGRSTEELTIGPVGVAPPRGTTREATRAPERIPNVGDLLRLLAARYGPEFAYYTRAADGSLPGHAMIVLDGTNLGHVRALSTPLGGATQADIIVMPAVGGG